MLDESRDLKSDQRPTRQGLRPFYIWTLVALVAVMVVGSPTLVKLSEQAGAAGWGWFAILHHGAVVALILGTVVLAPLVVIRSRTQGREFSRSYGASAVLATATGLGFAALQTLSVLFRFSQQYRSMPGRYWPVYMDIAAPVAVECSVVAITAAWLTLALTGVGRRSSNGFERLCLGLGLLWILAYLTRRVLDIAPWLF
ncbi:hypothetical protein [Paludisphaera borealis]|uniref:Uncharacterized protein n=1 Tax=Paludisphaera borealis TaxID=1387353 RepID=A0A1U7CTW6_9BACT|nr:hypothetical protein [Paludisphaera borealis]APW62371.1 hypothetical protein BSF38_03910 [Paludisphaera borealis]